MSILSQFIRSAVSFGVDRRESVRVKFDHPLPCKVIEVKSQCSFEGYLEEISRGGLRLFFPKKILEEACLLHVFISDEISKKTISVYVDAFPVKENKPNASGELFFYRCSIHSELNLPAEFVRFYQRMLDRQIR